MTASTSKAFTESYDVMQMRHQIDILHTLMYDGRFKRLLKEVREKDAIIFFGYNQVGKSTLINYLQEHSLIAYKDSTNNFKITTEDINGPSIGIPNSSNFPKVPQAWPTEKSIIIEMPSLEIEYRAQDIANAFFLKELVDTAGSVLFVMVADMDDVVNDNDNRFARFIFNFDELLPVCEKVKTALLLVINKDKQTTDMFDLHLMLDEKVVADTNQHTAARILVDQIMQRRNVIRIGVPTNEGMIPAKTGLGDLETKFVEMDRWSSCINHRYRGISKKSKDFLTSFAPYLKEVDALISLLSRIENEFQQRLDGFQFDHNTSMQRIELVKQDVLTLRMSFNTALDPDDLCFEDFVARIWEVLSPDPMQELGTVNMQLKFLDFLEMFIEYDGYRLLEIGKETFIGNVRKLFKDKMAHLEEIIEGLRVIEQVSPSRRGRSRRY